MCDAEIRAVIICVGGAESDREPQIACLGGAALDNEECYLLVKAMRMLGITYIEHQARI